VMAHWGVQPRRQRPGSLVVQRALRWLDPSVATLLWVHLYDAHHPYDPPQHYVDALVDRDPGGLGSEADVRAGKEWGASHMDSRSLPGFDRVRDVSTSVRDYAAEVAEVDGIVGELLAGLPDDAWIVVAADHGESLTEHGYLLNHGRHAFQATLRVPMIAVGPGFEAGVVVTTPAPSWLVGGTLRQWAGLEGQGLRDAVGGWDLPIESYAAGQEARNTFRLGGAGPELAVREGSHKRIVARGRRWAFDLSEDPGELNPVDVEADGLEERLEAIRSGHTDETPAWLEALGYTE
jgi:arylsulfatase A-like enzyme